MVRDLWARVTGTGTVRAAWRGGVMGRREALRRISLNDFRSQMRSVYSTTVAACTLDEAPDAYKPADEILRNIGDTVEVVKTIRPLYNYKAGAE